MFLAGLWARYIVTALVTALLLGLLPIAHGGTTQKNNADQNHTQQTVTPVNQHGNQNSLAEKQDTQQHDTKSLKQALTNRSGSEEQNPQSVSQAEKLKNEMIRLQMIEKNEPGRAIAGHGTNKKIIDIARLVNTYGGSPGDWSKMTSSSPAYNQGRIYSIHWYENIVTGERREVILKIDEIKKGRTGEHGEQE
ncbi:hypothetical protein [Pseudomonas aeruginosa]|uniref:hypothetical protein n=1 Tax=Pseudomonas aeruginosa TaxID=287 RepID=UPI000FF12D80|nr:hypothetical protein [Pseudomonas aeruginosa]RWX85879.1 hypothetical protein EQH81_12900 [Pseudomonas aeruginosa]